MFLKLRKRNSLMMRVESLPAPTWYELRRTRLRKEDKTIFFHSFCLSFLSSVLPFAACHWGEWEWMNSPFFNAKTIMERQQHYKQQWRNFSVSFSSSFFFTFHHHSFPPPIQRPVLPAKTLIILKNKNSMEEQQQTWSWAGVPNSEEWNDCADIKVVLNFSDVVFSQVFLSCFAFIVGIFLGIFSPLLWVVSESKVRWKCSHQTLATRTSTKHFRLSSSDSQFEIIKNYFVISFPSQHSSSSWGT